MRLWTMQLRELADLPLLLCSYVLTYLEKKTACFVVHRSTLLSTWCFLAAANIRLATIVIVI